MQRRILISILLAASAVAMFDSPAHAQFDPSSLLRRALGLSSEQLEGGIGSILTLAREKLAAGDFDQLADAIPGAGDYLETAKALGAVTGPIGDIDGLNSALGRLGIDQETAERFVPAARDLLSRLGSDEVGDLLNQVL